MTLISKIKKTFFLFFLAYLLFNGFIFSFLIPPFQKPDEFEHFKKVVSLASFDLKCQNKYQKVNKNLGILVNNFYLKSLPFNYNFKMPFSLYKSSYEKGVIKIDVSSGCRFKDVVGYIIPVGFYKLMSWVPVNGVLLFGAIRFFIFLFSYLVLILFILKNKNSVIRNLSFFILALPMTINQLSSFSYDVGHLFFGLLFTNVFFDLKEDKKYSFEKIIFLVLTFFLFVFSKPLYEFFVLLFFLLDKNKLKKIKIKKTFLIVFVFAVLIFLRFLNLEKTGSSLGVFNPDIQKTIILENPLRMIDVFKQTYFYSFEFYIKSAVGILGWLDFNLDFFVYLVFFVVFGILVGFYFQRLKIEVFEGLIYFLVVFLSILYIFLGEFLYWSEPGSLDVVGVQGRYLIILIPYFFFGMIFLIKKLPQVILFFCLLVLCYLNFYVTFKRYFDYSVYARGTSDVNSIKKVIELKPKEAKIYKIDQKVISCFGVFVGFKNKKIKEPVKVEVYDDKHYRVVYFPPSKVNYDKEATAISFAKTKFNSPIYVKISNPYSQNPIKIIDGVALSCLF